MKIKIEVTGPMACGKTHTLNSLEIILKRHGFVAFKRDIEKNTLTATKPDYARKAGGK